MKHATSFALYAYWQNRQRCDGVRARVIHAAELAPILPSVFLLGMNGQDEARFTFCGAAIAARYGRDLCHEPFLTLWNGEDRDVFERDLRSMAAQAEGLVAGMIAETLGGGFTSFELLLLPLSSDTGTAGVLGSMARVGGHEETNRVRSRIVSQSLRSARILPRPERRAAKRLETPDPALSGDRGDRPRRYGHLTVLSGGRRLDRVDRRRPLTDL